MTIRRHPCARIIVGLGIGVFLGALFSPSVSAQPTVLWTFEGDTDDAKLGRAVAGAGDLNNDGHDDVIVGAPGALFGLGLVTVYSGIDGSVLWDFVGDAGGLYLGTSVANAGDVNGDGVNDIIAGAPSYYPGASAPPGYARIYSGADGSVLRTLNDGSILSNSRYGTAVAGVGDTNGDGKSEVLVGAPGPGGISGGAFYLYSGADGNALLARSGTPPENLGRSLAGTGDLDGDGVPDFVVGSPGFANGKKLGAGKITVWSGATKMALKTITSKKKSGSFGWSVAGAGDFNGDGTPDIVVGAIGVARGKMIAAGQVSVISGKTFKSVGTFKGNQASAFVGTAVAGAGDIDGDGSDEIIVGGEGYFSFAGAVLVVSRKQGVLFSYTGGTGETYGDSVANAGDVDGDGVPDLIAGGWSASPAGTIHGGVAKVWGY